MFSTQERGQVGIGTLIVFIAMVLVAAIAAAVLINTAGLLQAQAQQTGEETTAEVSAGVEPQTATGLVAEATTETTDPPGVIDRPIKNESFVNEIRISVTKTAGSDPINLSKVSITYEANGQVGILKHESRAEAPKISDPTAGPPTQSDQSVTSSGENAFLIEAVQAEDDSDTLLTSQHDTYEIVIPLGVATNITESTPKARSGYELSPDNPIDEDAIEYGLAFPNDNQVPQNETYTLRDVTAPGNDYFDAVSYDNSNLYILPPDETIGITITTASGATRHAQFTSGESLSGKAGGSIIL